MENCTIIAALSNPDSVHLLRKGLKAGHGTLHMVEVKPILEELLPAVMGKSEPSIVFCEYDFLQRENWLESLRRTSEPAPGIVLIEETQNYEHLLEALRQGADDCLCLPLEPAEIAASIHRVKERSTGIKVAPPAETNNASRYLLWRYDLYRIPSNAFTIPQINKNYGTTFCEGLFRACFVEFSSTETPELVFQNTEMQDFTMYLCNKALQVECFDILFNRHTNGVSMLINYAVARRERISQLIEQLFFDLRREFEDTYQVSATMTVSHEYGTISKLPELKHEVLDARWYRRVHGLDGIIRADEIEQRQPLTVKQQRNFQNQWDAIVHYYELLDVERAVSCIQTLFETFESIISVRQTRICSRRLVTLLFEIYETELKTYGDRETLLQGYIYLETLAINTKQLQKVLVSNITDLMEKVLLVNRQQYTQPVYDCIAYIAGHYADNIRLQNLAQTVGLSPQYLSNLFHKETGQTISEYIVFQKLNAAQRLLKYSDKKINEIACELGFEDAHYFSKFFKKHLHTTPKEYRRIAQAKNLSTIEKIP